MGVRVRVRGLAWARTGPCSADAVTRKEPSAARRAVMLLYEPPKSPPSAPCDPPREPRPETTNTPATAVESAGFRIGMPRVVPLKFAQTRAAPGSSLGSRLRVSAMRWASEALGRLGLAPLLSLKGGCL